MMLTLVTSDNRAGDVVLYRTFLRFFALVLAMLKVVRERKLLSSQWLGGRPYCLRDFHGDSFSLVQD